jgi:hypothetical protein
VIANIFSVTRRREHYGERCDNKAPIRTNKIAEITKIFLAAVQETTSTTHIYTAENLHQSVPLTHLCGDKEA